MTEPTDGLAGKLFRAVGKAGGAVGKILSSASHAAGTTGQRAALTFASSAQGQPIPQHSPKELAGRLANDRACPIEVEGDSFRVIYTEPGLLARRFVFVFAPGPDRWGRPPVEPPGQVAYVVTSWPPGLFEVDPSQSVFVWNRGFRLGPRSAAADYISLWMKEWLGFVFDSRELVDKDRGPRPKGIFVGRSQELGRLAEILDDTGTDRRWIVSLTAHGGTGKSYFLERFERRFQNRMLYAQIDHQNVEARGEPLATLAGLIHALSQRLASGGCAMTHFEKLYAQFMRTLKPESSRPESGLLGLLRKAVRSGSGLLPVFGAAEAGLKFLDSISEEARREAEALASNRWIQRLTEAMVEDLEPFVKRQRTHFLLWRRPVIVLDTYEVLGMIADTWLRVCLLKNPDFQALQPLVVISGRYHLMNVDTRWSELQEAMLQMKLGPMDEQESRQYLAELGASPEQIEGVLPLTGGMPLFISLVAHSPSSDAAVRLLTGRVLEEVDPELRPRFMEAAVAEGFNRDVLARLLDPGSDIAAIYERLSGCTFVESRQGLWHFAPLVRSLLLQSLELDSPDRLKEIRARLNPDAEQPGVKSPGV